MEDLYEKRQSMFLRCLLSWSRGRERKGTEKDRKREKEWKRLAGWERRKREREREEGRGRETRAFSSFLL